MKNFNRFMLIAMFSFFSASIYASSYNSATNSEVSTTQSNITIKGVVKDDSGVPVIGAMILVKGTSTATITNADGSYKLTATDGAEITIECIGYDTQSFKVTTAKTDYNIILDRADLELEEVVITAYGGRQLRSEVTTSIAKVDKEVFEKSYYENPASVLRGTVAGLEIKQSTANPLMAPTITLRGGTDWDGSGTPLYVIDGQIYSHMHYINPDDIESMEVLKDAGSTAIYGARANNGVILITTKRGSKGRSSIQVSSNITIKKFREPYNYLNAEDYLYWYRSGVANAARVYKDDNGDWQGFADINTLSNTGAFGTGNMYFDTDGSMIDGNQDSRGVWSPMIYSDNLAFLLNQGWQTMTDPVFGDEILFSEFDLGPTQVVTPTVSQNYSLSMTGGNDRGNYYASLAYMKDVGNVPNNYLSRINFTLNGDYQVNDWLKSISGLKFSSTDQNGLSPTLTNESNYFYRLFSIPPTMRQYNPDGDLILGNSSSDGNQLVNIDQFDRTINLVTVDLSQAFEVQIYKDLKFRANANWYYCFDTRESFNKDYLQSPGVTNTTRSSSVSYDKDFKQMYNAFFNYDKTIGDHNFSLMAGGELYDYYIMGMSASGSGAPTDDFADLALTSTAENMRSIDSNHSRERIMSAIGRANYSYKSKYLLEFVARYDGYSRLLGDNKFGFFPGVSGGWVIGREDFMEPLRNVISFAKIRTSYGLNGNTSGIGVYQLQGSYASSRYNGNVGYSLSAIPNPYLRWEKSHTFDMGLDVSLFDNKVNLDITYYNRVTKDKYASIPLPSSSGITSFTTNNGELLNKGIEISANIRVLNKGDWSWNVNVNAAHNRNKVLSLPDNGLENNRQGGSQIWDPNNPSELIWVGGYYEGQNLGVNDRVAYIHDGVYATWADIPNNLVVKSVTAGGASSMESYSPDLWAQMSEEERQGKLPITPGDTKWRDVNGDGIIDQYDRQVVGNTRPTWTGGITSNLSWKGIALNIRMDYALGFTAYDYPTSHQMGAAQGLFNTVELVKETWTPENPTAKYPRFDRADQLGKNNHWRGSSLYIYNANYLAIREVGLSYDIPSRIANKLSMQNARVLLTVKDLGYIMSEEMHRLYQPEYGSSTGGGYPTPLTFVAGINLTF